MQQLRTLAALCLLVPAVLVGVGTGAHASVVTEVDLVQRQLVIRDVGDVQHHLTVRREGTKVIVTDSDILSGGSGCTVAATKVICEGAGSTIQEIAVSTGTKDDVITVDVPGLRAVLWAGEGNDRVTVTNSSETLLRGGHGSDVLRGGPGADRFVEEQAIDGADAMAGGPGSDSVDYSTRLLGGLTITADGKPDDGQTSIRGGKEGDNVAADIENLRGTDRGDVLIGSGVDNRIYGLGGDDIVDGTGGNDSFDPAAGADRIRGGNGNDRVEHTSVLDGADTFEGGPGVDTVSYLYMVANAIVTLDGKADDGPATDKDNNLDVENAVGNRFTNRLTGNAGDNVLIGGDAADYIHGLGGNDSIRGNGGNDQLFGEDGNDTLLGGFGVDLLDAGNGNDSLDGGDGNDQLLGQAGNDTLHGGFGAGGKSTDDDVLNGGTGFDLASYSGRKGPVRVDADNVADDGQPGELDNVLGSIENLAGGNGNDTLTGNAAPNLLYGGVGDDTITVTGGGAPKDTADGNAGRDTCRADKTDTRKNCEL